MKSPSVFIIILSYNSAPHIVRCLQSVFRLNYSNFEVIVVDNNSADTSAALVKKKFPRAHLICVGNNQGFSAGNNIGIRYALEKMADYVMLLNPDTEIATDALAALLREAQRNTTAGVFAPILLNSYNNSIWYAGGTIQWWRMRAVHCFYQKADRPYSTELASGCAMLVKKEVFGRAGLLDERFFLYYEDAEFSQRVRSEGYEIVVVPQARVVHWEASNEVPQQKLYWLVFSGLVFFLGYSKGVYRGWMHFLYLLRLLKNKIDCRRLQERKAHQNALTVSRAYHDYAKHR